MGARAIYKRFSDLVAWDLDPGCRAIVNQATPGRRRLKRVLKRAARRKLKLMSSRDSEQ